MICTYGASRSSIAASLLTSQRISCSASPPGEGAGHLSQQPSSLSAVTGWCVSAGEATGDQELQRAAGHADHAASTLCGTAAMREHGEDRHSRHPAMTPEMIRQLPAGRALVIRGGYAPVIARLPMAWKAGHVTVLVTGTTGPLPGD